MNASGYGLKPQKTKIPGYKQFQEPVMGPAQLSLLENMIAKLSGGIEGSADYLTKLASGDESMFQQLEKPAYTSFEKLLGQIGTRFSGLGARDSSYFENAVSGAGAEMAERLQSQRLGLRNQAIESLLNQSNSLLNQRPYQSHFFPKGESNKTDWGKLVGMLVGGAGGAAIGGPTGAFGGAQMGANIGSGLF
jgi:hypothetical protein